jgi:hypothetical protein
VVTQLGQAANFHRVFAELCETAERRLPIILGNVVIIGSGLYVVARGKMVGAAVERARQRWRD